MSLQLMGFMNQAGIEPMQVDVEPQEHDINEQQDDDQNFIVENPTLDLEMYTANYSGLMKTERLLFIAKHAPSLKVEAYRMALAHVQKSFNVGLYHNIHEMLAQAIRESSFLPDAVVELTHQIPSLDTAWMELTAKKAATLLEKLDTDLKNYKDNSIKESIRRGHDDLGNHYLNMGEVPSALKCYSRARDYCTSPKHIISMCLNVIQVSVYLQNWSHVLTYVNKAEATGEFADKERDNHSQSILAKLKCAAGLAELAIEKYKLAAKHFLQVSVDHCDFPELLSASNVAVYGSLCALATFTRTELQKLVINSSSFKLLLELEPQVRDIVFAFYESNYSKCLSSLQSIRDNLRLDIYLSPHVDRLYAQIRNRSLVQYFSPYMMADMRKMANAFNSSLPDLENEIMQLILDGEIQARIDSENKILHAKDTDQRSLTFEKTVQVGTEYLQRVKAMILRSAVLRNNIHVQSGSTDKSQSEVSGSGR
ncbi:COP9 signalosome complex subunit 1-like isoform X1 [Styela clava]|uniref:COP9 signalosome complex subunit 1-like isoform X1 n=1 Tax=Styela clava TaxID=7725 RepID=UPI0019399298|nr:COP9 signalosome complex subunit 1-like isoform X1 [Styela clava]